MAYCFILLLFGRVMRDKFFEPILIHALYRLKEFISPIAVATPRAARPIWRYHM
jgi:hypothetical protein